MKALLKVRKGVGNVEIRDVEEKSLQQGEIRIEVKAAGICGSDLHIFRDSIPYVPPVILGHEFSGLVSEISPGVKEFEVGDRVTGEPSLGTCGKCAYCRIGEYNLCPDRIGLGRITDGVFAKYIALEENLVHKLPDSLDFVTGTFCEPLSVGVHAVKKAACIHPNDTVVISGPGVIGNFVAQLVKLAGARTVVLGTSLDTDRLSMAKKVGADLTINVEKENPLEIISDVTNGYGADTVFECSGSSGAYNTCVEMLRKQGQYVQIGVSGKPASFDFDKIVFKELSVKGSFSMNYGDFETAILLLAEKKIGFAPLSISEYSLTDWKQGFEESESKKSLKVILNPVD